MATRMAAAQSFIMVMAVDLFCDAKEKRQGTMTSLFYQPCQLVCGSRRSM
jgi:hypothetical protein